MNQQLTLPAGSCHGPEEEAPAKNQIPAEETLWAAWRRLETGVRPWRKMGHGF